MTQATAISRELLLAKYQDGSLAQFVTNLIQDDCQSKGISHALDDEEIYDFISQWDELFNDQDGWYFEEGEEPKGWMEANDIKDSIRDEIEELLN